MLRRRIIPRILVREQASRLVAVVSKDFNRFFTVGNPLSQVKIMDSNKADEISIIYTDEPSQEKKDKFFDFLDLAVKSSMTPISAGGGIHTVDEMRRFMGAGIEKLVLPINPTLENLDLVEKVASRHGSQALQVSLDYRVAGDRFLLKTSERALNAEEINSMLSKYIEAGAGEISFCSIDRDGSKSGLDLTLLKLLIADISVPVILGGGAGEIEHFVEGLVAGADGVVSGTYLARMDHSLLQVRSKIAVQGVNVREI